MPTIEELIASLDAELSGFDADRADLTLREKVLRLVKILGSTKKMGVAVVRDDGCDATSGLDRMLLYMRENVGVTLDAQELEVVSGISEYGRRLRELRTEHGFPVATHFTGRPDLKQGQYVLESSERVAEPHDRHIPTKIEEAVYQRDRNTCCNCGWNRKLWRRSDPRFLELHHLKPHVQKGENIPANLVVLCSRCHDDVHAKRLIVTSEMLGNPPEQFMNERQPLL